MVLRAPANLFRSLFIAIRSICVVGKYPILKCFSFGKLQMNGIRSSHTKFKRSTRFLMFSYISSNSQLWSHFSSFRLGIGRMGDIHYSFLLFRMMRAFEKILRLLDNLRNLVNKVVYKIVHGKVFSASQRILQVHMPR